MKNLFMTLLFLIVLVATSSNTQAQIHTNQTGLSSISEEAFDRSQNLGLTSDPDNVNTVFNALKALYKSTDGGNWTNNSGWDTTRAPVRVSGFQQWYGIDVLGNSIVSLGLSNNNLIGSIPPEIGDLKGLGILWISKNKLSGSIPPEISKLVNLQKLDIGTNELTGAIPAELGRLKNLQGIWLLRNQLTGPIPILNSPNLEALNVSENQLTGKLPNEYLDLKRLQILWMDRNDGLCIPDTSEFRTWANRIADFRGTFCITGVATEEGPVIKDIRVFPNPAIDQATFVGLPYDASVTIYDVLGRQVLTTTESRIDLSGLSRGLYMYTVTSDTQVPVKGKFIKQ